MNRDVMDRYETLVFQERVRKFERSRKGRARELVRRHTGQTVLILSRRDAPSYDMALRHADAVGLHVAMDRAELIYWRLPAGASYNPPADPSLLTLDQLINQRAEV